MPLKVQPAVIGCAGVLLWGYIANRYMADFMPLVIVAVASALLLLDALSIDGFRALPVPAISTFLMPVGLFYTGLFLIAGDDILYGGWTALGLSGAAVLFSAIAWITDRRG